MKRITITGGGCGTSAHVCESRHLYRNADDYSVRWAVGDVKDNRSRCFAAAAAGIRPLAL